MSRVSRDLVLPETPRACYLEGSDTDSEQVLQDECGGAGGGHVVVGRRQEEGSTFLFRARAHGGGEQGELWPESRDKRGEVASVNLERPLEPAERRAERGYRQLARVCVRCSWPYANPSRTYAVV